MSSRTDTPFWQNRQTFLKEHTHSRKQYFVYVGVYVGAFVLSKKIVCSVTKACLQSLSVLFGKFVCSFKMVYMLFQKGLSVLSKKCVCSVKKVRLLFQKGVSVLLKKGCLFFQKGRYVCSVKEVFLFCQRGVSVLSKSSVCSVRQVYRSFQKGLSVLSKKCFCYVKEVKKVQPHLQARSIGIGIASEKFTYGSATATWKTQL